MASEIGGITAPALNTPVTVTTSVSATEAPKSFDTVLTEIDKSMPHPISAESKTRESGGKLEFAPDPQSGQMVMKIRDISTGDVIRQIPSEQALEMARALGQIRGVFLADKA